MTLIAVNISLLEDLIAHDMFALLEAIQLSLKSRNLMPAQKSLHCTAQFIFMATHVQGENFFFLFRGLHIQCFGKFRGLLFELSGATFSISGAPFSGATFLTSGATFPLINNNLIIVLYRV